MCYLITVTKNPRLNMMLRAADRYAYTGCGSTAYSVGTVYGGKRDLYTPDARPALLATPCLASLATPWLASLVTPCWRRPARPVGDALLAGPGRPCLPNSNRNAAYSQHL